MKTALMIVSGDPQVVWNGFRLGNRMLEQMDDVAMLVAENLDFNMARALDEFFEHDAAVAKGGFGFTHGAE